MRSAFRRTPCSLKLFGQNLTDQRGPWFIRPAVFVGGPKPRTIGLRLRASFDLAERPPPPVERLLSAAAGEGGQTSLQLLCRDAHRFSVVAGRVLRPNVDTFLVDLLLQDRVDAVGDLLDQRGDWMRLLGLDDAVERLLVALGRPLAGVGRETLGVQDGLDLICGARRQ